MKTRGNGPIAYVGRMPAQGEEYAWTKGVASKLLDLQEEVGLDPADGFYTNLLSFHLDKPKEEDFDEAERLWEELSWGPSIIVAMGREAARFFLGDVDMEAVHGVPRRVVIPQLGPERRVVIPVFNPGLVVQCPERTIEALEDFRAVADVYSGVYVYCDTDTYNPVYGAGFVDPGNAQALYMDTEGWADNPYCVTYSWRPGRAQMVLASDREGLAKLADVMDSVDTIVLHNCLHDIPVLEAMGLRVKDSQLADTMVMAYNLQTEPQGLKPLALRYAAMQMGSYDDLVKPYDEALALEYLETVNTHDWGKAEPYLVQDSKTGEYKVTQPRGINSRVASLLKKGEDYRKGWLAIESRGVVEEILGPMPEATLDMVPFDKVLYYACRDADATGRVYPKLLAKVKRAGLLKTYQTDMGVIPMVAAMHRHGILADKQYFEDLGVWLNDEAESVRRKIMGYNGGRWINPDSPQQVRELLFDRLRLPTGKRTKSGEYSTQDKVLESLRTAHEAAGLICDYRELQTMRNDFAEKLPRFAGADGRVRCTFRVTRVVSGRLSATNPNLMAIPVRGELGKKTRDGFVAKPGWKLGSIDLDQAEIKVFASLAKEQKLIDAILAGADVHMQTAQLIFGVDKPSKEQRTVGKRVGFGVITGIQAGGLYDQMRLAGIHEFSRQDCQGIIDRYFEVYPAAWRFIEDCRNAAYRDGMIRDVIGRIRYLGAVWATEDWKVAEAERQSHSHVIQASAQAHLKIAMGVIWPQIAEQDWIRPLIQVHDELIVECREDRLAEAEAIIVPAMQGDYFGWPTPMTASFTWGDRWGQLK